ncbi:MAG: hypothetical protein KAJ18_12165 [Candidatus Omnitrophica bacterium]|nr:hypothetical protein [Candidatus Omnitrophota bacterium]
MFIDINTNLPDDGTWVLVKLENGIITGARYFSETGFESVGVYCANACVGNDDLCFNSPVMSWKGE